MFLEGVGDVFEEDEAEDDVLVLIRASALTLRAAYGSLCRSAPIRRVHVVAELVGGEPKLGLEADGGG